MTLNNYIIEYHERIQSGEIIGGNWIRLFYDRLIDDLQTGRVTFSAKKAGFAVAFVEAFCLYRSMSTCQRKVYKISET